VVKNVEQEKGIKKEATHIKPTKNHQIVIIALEEDDTDAAQKA
jgi:hypothetical protein